MNADGETATDIPVDTAQLAAWMDDRALGQGPVEGLAAIGGGSQNVVVRFRRDDRAYVLRRPPRHKRPESDETIRREMRVLAALDGTSVPHPRLIAAESDATPLGAAFYLMEPVEGFNPSRSIPEPHRSDAGLQEGIGLAMVDALGALAQVDFVAAGLDGFGRPDGWLERQVDRWRRQLASYGSLRGYVPSVLPGQEEIATWLEAHRPTQSRPGIIHGDFSLANVLVHPERGEVAAVVDWELATIGDPLLDLGHLLATWPHPRGREPFPWLDAPMLPSREALVERYNDVAGRSTDQVGWYQALACYRLASILEGTYARSCAGLAPRDVGERLHRIAVAMLDQATALIAAR